MKRFYLLKRKRMLVSKEDIICPMCCTTKVWEKTHLTEVEVEDWKLLYWKICEWCTKEMETWVTLFCMWEKWTYDSNWQTISVPCCNCFVVTPKVLKKHWFKRWKDFTLWTRRDINWCPQCAHDKKIHFI